MGHADCEGIAASVRERGGFDDDTSPWEIAAWCGLRSEYGPRGCKPLVRSVGGRWVARLDPAERPARQGMALLHELAHLLLIRAGVTNDEQHAWWLSAALLLPRDSFLRELRRANGAVEQLVDVFPHASHEALARRRVTLAESMHLWVVDVEPRWNRYRVTSPGWRWPGGEPTAPEAEAIRYALEGDGAVEPVGGVRAWRVNDEPYVRVLCLADGEVLMAGEGCA